MCFSLVCVFFVIVSGAYRFWGRAVAITPVPNWWLNGHLEKSGFKQPHWIHEERLVKEHRVALHMPSSCHWSATCHLCPLWTVRATDLNPISGGFYSKGKELSHICLEKVRHMTKRCEILFPIRFLGESRILDVWRSWKSVLKTRLCLQLRCFVEPGSSLLVSSVQVLYLQCLMCKQKLPL